MMRRLPWLDLVVALLLAVAHAAFSPAACGWNLATPSPHNAVQAAAESAAHDGHSQFLSLFDRLDLREFIAMNSLTQWSILLSGALGGVLIGRIVAVVLLQLGKRAEDRNWRNQSRLLSGLAGPLDLALIGAGLALGFASLKMTPELRLLANKSLLLILLLAGFWYLFNLIAVLDLLIVRVIGQPESSLDRHLAPLIRKSLRAAVVVLGAMFIVQSVFHQDIGAWLAGLGIVGLAVSLAAQDSLKNIFGSITILLDRPFQVGERIVFAGYDGTIEEIGFRSTKIRTPAGHQVNIPNSKIVSESVENIGRRPAIRRLMNVTIPYDTPRAKIEQAVAILRALLEEDEFSGPIHPTIGTDAFPPRVFFSDFNPDSLNILVLYWYAPPNYWDYMAHAERLNLRIFSEFEKAGIEFAFPTQTLNLAGDPKRQLALSMLGRDLQSP